MMNTPWISNGSRMIRPGWVITSMLPVTLLIRTATWPASTVVHERAASTTTTSAAAASQSRDGSPRAPRMKSEIERRTRSVESLMISP
jgi:hypothetical protein